MIQTILAIDGMACRMCESHVNDAVRNHFPVKKVVSSHKRGTCEILSGAVLGEDELRAVIEESGYRVLSYEAKPYQKKGLFDLLR